MKHVITISLTDVGESVPGERPEEGACEYKIEAVIQSKLHPVDLAKKAAMAAANVLEAQEDVLSFHLVKTAEHKGGQQCDTLFQER